MEGARIRIPETVFKSTTPPFIYLTSFTENLLCARHSSKYWRQSHEQVREGLCPLVGEEALEQTNLMEKINKKVNTVSLRNIIMLRRKIKQSENSRR